MVSAQARFSYKFGVIPLLIIAFLYSIFIIFRFADNQAFSSPALLFLLNTIFYTVIGFLVSFVSAKSYLSEGSINVLVLGLATAVGGVAASIAGWASTISINYNVAIFNIGFFLAGGLLFLSAIITVTAALPSPVSQRKTSLVISYSAVITAILVLSGLVIYGYAPLFFTISGPTLIRQWILGTGLSFFACSSLIFAWQFFETKKGGLYWYSIGLALLAFSLFGSMVVITPNGVFNWIVRISGYIAGFYFLQALLVARKEKGLPGGFAQVLSEKWADTFRSDHKQLEMFFSKIKESFAYCKILTDKTGKPVDWIYLDVNDAFEQSTQGKKEKIIGKKISEILPKDSGLEEWVNFYGEVALTGVPASGERFLEYNCKWYHVSVYSPRKGYFMSIFEDITERKIAEDELRASEQRFKLVAEAANVMVYETDVLTGKVISVRGLKEIVGFEPDEGDLPLDRFLNCVHPQDKKRIMQLFKKASLGEVDNFSVEYKFRHKEGDYIFVRHTAIAVRDDAGRVIRLVGGIRDITRRKMNEQKIALYSKHLEELVAERTKELKDAERLAAIGATAGMVGHDIRNPLQAMISDVYLIKEEISLEPESKTKQGIIESLESLEQNISYINKIVADLQDYARPLRPECVNVDLSEILSRIFENISVPESVKLSIEVKDLENLRADPMFLQRALSNLVSNAIQAMPKGGILKITGQLEQDKAFITVSDTGVGIPDEIKPKLFTPMMTTKSKGQGFGLAVSKRLVESMKGTISFESEKDKGTKFLVELPTCP